VVAVEVVVLPMPLEEPTKEIVRVVDQVVVEMVQTQEMQGHLVK
tara:strand:+ start:421 stop:552 length:132 start_codon:yes stop_codon:yes gene_type:complete